MSDPHPDELRARAARVHDLAGYHRGEAARCLRALARGLLAQASRLEHAAAARPARVDGVRRGLYI